jgi:hypothetical protein
MTMAHTLSIPCADCERRKQSLELQHFRVLGCNPDPNKAKFCVLEFEDPILGAGAAPGPHAPGQPAGAAFLPQTLAAQPLPFAGRAAPVSGAAFDKAVADLGVLPQTLWSLVKVETSGCGFLADRRPQILFERHKFSAATQGRFDKQAPDISSPTAGGWIGGSAEYQRLSRAMGLDRQAALASTSWGLGQIMGFNAKAAGFADVQALVKASADSEDAQLAAMAAFIAHGKLDEPLRAKDWAAVARAYNGQKFKEHDYDGQLRRYFEYFTDHGTPDLRVREAQLGLLILGYAPQGSVDGVYGGRTADALARFAHDQGIAAAPGDKVADAVLQRIRSRAGWA